MKLVIVGGFLGSGKTTAIVNACRYLMQQQKRVAVITNDQGDQQVDTAFVSGNGIPVGEVSNGCFCCHFDQLDRQLETLTRTVEPEIIFAEAVGSCTDLIATLVKPLHKLRPTLKVVVSIFADAGLLASIITGKASFLSEDVRYLYQKQLEEGDFLILNKTDTLSPKALGKADEALKAAYPHKTIVHQNALEEDDIARWLHVMDQFTQIPTRNALSIDYNTYAAGEARLAWLDLQITLSSAHDNCLFITQQIIASIFDAIQLHRLVIGHLKFFLESGAWSAKISFTTTSTRAQLPSFKQAAHRVGMLINARVQADPLALQLLIDEVLLKAEKSYAGKIERGKWSCFTPGYPSPSHRMD